MRIDILTLHPDMFRGPLTESILKRAVDKEHLTINIHNIRDHSTLRHNQVDDKPYGGGAGMLMMAEPIVRCMEAIIGDSKKKPHRIYLSPRGKRLTQTKVERLAKKKWILLLCGHYEGVDQRVIDGWIDEEVSIGDYVLTGGEIPAMVIVDAVSRHIPGVLGHEESAAEESFSQSLGRKREYPHYTRPDTFRDMKVPDVLISGDHKKIAEWRKNNVR